MLAVLRPASPRRDTVASRDMGVILVSGGWMIRPSTSRAVFQMLAVAGATSQAIAEDGATRYFDADILR